MKSTRDYIGVVLVPAVKEVAYVNAILWSELALALQRWGRLVARRYARR